MRLRKLMFVLPNLFTVSSIFCGFYSLQLCLGDATPQDLYGSALAILFAFFFDGFDGRVARLTKTQSQFGMELDSLADVVSFGVAPAMLVYRWALEPFGLAGTVVAFAFTACGALRLARFNVIAIRSPAGGSPSHFVGLPIPLAASMIISLVIAHHVTQGGAALADSGRVPVAIMTVALSLLMVSTVRYRTFKHLKVSRASVSAAAFVLGGGVLIGTQLHFAYVLVAYFSLYLLLGLVESGFFVTRRLVAARVEGRRGPEAEATASAGPLDPH